MTSGHAHHWAVVGGGMLGMTLALRLAQRGQRVTLFEAADHLGGLADAWQVGNLVWDRHYHVTLLSDSHLRGLLAELNLEQEVRWVETRTGFFTESRLLSLSNSWEFLRFPPLGLLDKLRLGLTIFYASKLRDWRRLENITVGDWLRRWSGERTYRKIWLPLLRAKLGENHTRSAATFIWATIARLYAARRTGLKKEMFGYVPGGYARVLEHLQRRLRQVGVEVRTGHAVERVQRSGAQIEFKFAHGDCQQFDRAVLTAPAPAIARICPQLSADERARFSGVSYQGVVCASLVCQRPLTGFYVTNITDDAPFSGIIEMTTLVDPAHFGGMSLVYLPKYVPADDPLFDQPDAKIEASFVAALERMFPWFNRQQVQASRISRVRNVMAVPTLGYSQRVPPRRTSVPGLFAVTSAQIVNNTLNVNETIRLAEEALTDLLHDEALPKVCISRERETEVETAGHVVVGS
ncbi:MAG: NAD(P)/FAD-dependent oxidoreductase [Pirellulales bacterium]|nr:NAD(P)/FAD-dependent oxidoreductase [Pirellulales bacterium]